MGTRHALTALMLTVAVAACAGPSATDSPTPTVAPASPSPISNSTPTSGSTETPSATSGATTLPTGGDGPTDAPVTTSPTPQTPSWTERADVAPGPSAREDHTWTVNADGTLAYLFGGRGAAGTMFNDLWQFDLVADAWTELEPATDPPAARFGHTATWVPDVGLVVWSGQGARFFDDIWRYDPTGNAWEELPASGAVPSARYGSCASLGPDGELWISHGFTADDGRFADTRSYNFSTATWTDRTPAEGDLPVERCLHDCFWSNSGQLVLYGGQTTGVTALGDLWVLDPTTQTWTQGPEQQAPARNLYALTTIGGDAIMFGGGSTDGGFLDDAWQSSVEGDSYTLIPAELPAGPGPRSSATAITDLHSRNVRVLLFGGMDADGVLGDLWELRSGT